jgi:TctA family transporter
VLGGIFDKSFRRSWVINDGDFTFYFGRPISVVLMALCVLTLVMSFGPPRRLMAGAWAALVGLGGSLLARVRNRGRR